MYTITSIYVIVRVTALIKKYLYSSLISKSFLRKEIACITIFFAPNF